MTTIDAIINRIVLLLQSTITIVNKLLAYLYAQINQLIYDLIDELLGGTVKAINDFLQNLFEAECYRSLMVHIPVEIRQILKKIFSSFAYILNEIINLLSSVLKVLGELLGRHSLLKECTKLIQTLIENALEEIKDMTKDLENDPQVILWVKDAANDLTQCSNIILKGVTYEIEYINQLVDNCGVLVSKILQNLIKCLTSELSCLQQCMDRLIETSQETLNEIKVLVTLENAQSISSILYDTQNCVKKVIDNLKNNIDYIDDYNEQR